MKRLFKKALAKSFRLGQRFGVDILPRHFYSEIPVIHQLQKTDLWRKPYSLIGLDANADDQLAFAREVMTPAILEHLRDNDVYAAACADNGAAGFGPIEAQFLYAFVRRRQPKRIIQVGCGVSTSLCLSAAASENYRSSITCVEPYPTPFLQKAAQAGQIRLIQQKVEELPTDFVTELEPGDFLFIDSTHTLGPAGEVTRIVLELLPRLAEGVWVHFHDIWLPYDFAPAILDQSLFFWHETALLSAFLCFNSRFSVRCSLSQLHHQRLEQLTALFANYDPMRFDRGVATSKGCYPSSIYLSAPASRLV